MVAWNQRLTVHFSMYWYSETISIATHHRFLVLRTGIVSSSSHSFPAIVIITVVSQTSMVTLAFNPSTWETGKSL